MLSDSLKNYLIQTQQLFGDNVILPTIGTDFFVITEGDLNSKILFIKESLDDNPIKEKEKILFSNILKALNLSLNNIFLMSISKDKENTKFSSLSNKIEPLVIVIFGSCISKIFLNDLYKGVNIISTYSLVEMINNSNCKKSVWKDLKSILTIIK